MLNSVNKTSVSGYLLVTAITALVAGCGGGGGGQAATALAELTVDSPSTSEGNSGTTVLSFAVNLDQTDAVDVSFDFATADDTTVDQANAGSDYDAANGSITIPAGFTSATIDVTITGDSDVENDETLLLNLSNISSNATLITSSATGTILNDDVVVIPPTPSSSALNDTGVTTCSDDFVNGLDCNSVGDGTDQYPGQDAEHGRDVTGNDDSDGHAGFSFTKLDSSGNPLSDQSGDYIGTPWSCVLDEITGRIWEVKADDDALRDKSWTYSWYFGNGISTTINNGTTGVSNRGDCVDDQNCDTEKYTDAVNLTQLCGYDDWRLPSRRELLSIMHFGAETPHYIDTNFFPNHVQFPYWSASNGGGFDAFFVEYSSIGARSAAQADDYSIRLVRGGQ